MEAIFFWLFAIGMLLGGLAVILNRNPVASALCLVLTILGLAGLFVMLHAFLLAAIQILVYAGAVMVLFLFIIMLLDLKAEGARKIRVFGLVSGLGVSALFFWVLWRVLGNSPQGTVLDSSLPNSAVNDIPLIAGRLFTQYILPFEVVGVLLLVAMLGVILLTKKELK
jgi:NADH-quinone oxidoreductase subunit J